MKKKQKLSRIAGHRSGCALSHLSGRPPHAGDRHAAGVYLLLFCGHGRAGMLFEGQIRRGKAVPAPKPDCRGAARRAARRRGLEHVPAACALPAGRLAHVRALGKAALYARRVVRCVLLLRSSRCCFSPAPWKNAAGQSGRKCSPFFSWETLCFSFSRAIASSQRI